MKFNFKTLKFKIDWLNDFIPEDIKIPSTTVVTGPAGAAKEILGSMIAASWLNIGGSLIHVLTNFNRDHAERLLSYYDVNVDKLSNKVVYINFDPQTKKIKQINENEFQANILNPTTFDEVIDEAKNTLQKSNSEILNYMTALNMLLYSKTYSESVYNNYQSKINKNSFNLFTFSNNIFPEKISKLENKADNVFYVHGTGILHLSMKMLKINGSKVSGKEIETPITEGLINKHLLEIQNRRKELVPIIKKI